jgi:hypothetical protein
MSLLRDYTNRSQRPLIYRAVLAAVVLFAIFAARGVPPDFSQALNPHSTIAANSHHDQRPRFVDSAYQWGAPPATFQLTLPNAELAGLIVEPEVFSTIQTKGFHFNRPPPVI